MLRKNKFDYAGAIVLGMHDALVSLTGLIAGLAVAMVDRYAIILTSVIASVTASLSMGASNYLAMRTNGNTRAIVYAIYTGSAYMATCAALILPFFIFENRAMEITIMFIIAVLEIFAFNCWLGHVQHRRYIANFLEMLAVCTTVSVVAFIIGWCAQKIWGIQI